MDNIALKQVNYEGITMQVPQKWEVNTEAYDEEDGTKSYTMSINAKGRDARSVNISWGTVPEGYDAYNGACATYDDVVGEEDLSVNDEPILCFEFQGKKAYGFSAWADGDMPCFFFCQDIPSEDKKKLLTVLMCAANNEDLESLMDFVEENLAVE